MEKVEDGVKEMRTLPLFGGSTSQRDDLQHLFMGMRSVITSRTRCLFWTENSVSNLQIVIIEKINRSPFTIENHLNVPLLSLLLEVTLACFRFQE